MILVLWRRSPAQAGFAEWQDLLLTLALFDLPLTVVISGDAAEALDQPGMQQRIEQLVDIGIGQFFLCDPGATPPSTLPFTRISPQRLAQLCQQARQMVHC